MTTDKTAAATPPPETVYVSERKVSCEGVGGALGHPLVWYELGEDGRAECLYCDRVFIYDVAKAQGR